MRDQRIWRKHRGKFAGTLADQLADGATSGVVIGISLRTLSGVISWPSASCAALMATWASFAKSKVICSVCGASKPPTPDAPSSLSISTATDVTAERIPAISVEDFGTLMIGLLAMVGLQCGCGFERFHVPRDCCGVGRTRRQRRS